MELFSLNADPDRPHSSHQYQLELREEETELLTANGSRVMSGIIHFSHPESDPVQFVPFLASVLTF